MNDEHVPSLSEVVDVLTARIEYAEVQGLDAEREALNDARECVLAHVFREHRNVSIIQTILDRMRIRPAA